MLDTDLLEVIKSTPALWLIGLAWILILACWVRYKVTR
jgi:hypothetical protein